MPDGAIHYKFYLLKLTMAVDNFVFRIITGALGGLFVRVSVYVCPRTCCHIARRMTSGSTFSTSNNVSNFGGDPVTQLIVNVYQMIV